MFVQVHLIRMGVSIRDGLFIALRGKYVPVVSALYNHILKYH
jgi:hypothetical protein